jgi:hypothetical protein
MARDRVDEDEIPLTHEFLSLMLGVRRAGVTVALKKRALLDAGRRSVKVVDRKGLERSRANTTACRKPNCAGCWADSQRGTGSHWTVRAIR